MDPNRCSDNPHWKQSIMVRSNRLLWALLYSYIRLSYIEQQSDVFPVDLFVWYDDTLLLVIYKGFFSSWGCINFISTIKVYWLFIQNRTGGWVLNIPLLMFYSVIIFVWISSDICAEEFETFFSNIIGLFEWNMK